MFELKNLGVYFPIQLWEFKEQNLYRFQPPKFGTVETYEFWPHFIDSIDSVSLIQREYVLENWKLTNVFWCFNPSYANLFTRGFLWLYIEQINIFPFCSYTIGNVERYSELDVNKFYSGLSFLTYSYSIENTSLLMITYDNRNRQIINVDLNQYNDKISFDFIKKPFIYFYLYVFMEKPRNVYWKPNSENICIPSNDTSDYATLVDCVADNVDKLVNRKTYLQSNNDPLKTIMEGQPSWNTRGILLVLVILVLSIVLLAYILSNTTQKQPIYQK